MVPQPGVAAGAVPAHAQLHPLQQTHLVVVSFSNSNIGDLMKLLYIIMFYAEIIGTTSFVVNQK